MFDTLFFKKFLIPAMTYEDFYLMSDLDKLRSYENLKIDNNHSDYQCAFNGTSTKCVIIKQPTVLNDIMQLEKSEEIKSVEFEL